MENVKDEYDFYGEGGLDDVSFRFNCNDCALT
jgi:hypothetical protein